MRTGLLALSLTLIGCAPVEDARAQWLRHTLVLDNQVFLERAPELTAGKFALMGEQLYPFFRGTAPQFARDAMVPGGAGYHPSAFVTAENRDVLLVGDPHPENIGTFRRPDGTIVVEFNDFDAATYGPFTFDLRRLALGFWIAGVDAAVAAADRRAAVEALVAAYVDTMTADAPGAADLTGAIVDDLVGEALERGGMLEKLADYTVLDGETRVMFDGDVEPARLVWFGEASQLVVEDSVRPPSAEQRSRMLALEAAYRGRAEVSGEVLGISRRYGAGVSSYPQERFYVLLAGPTDDPDDDILLEAKETVDPVILPGVESLPGWSAQNNGERVVTFQRELQGHRDDDPHLGWAVTGGQSFRFRHRTAYQRGFRVSRMAAKLSEEDWRAADFVEFAAFAGSLLARSHARARTQRGTSAKVAISMAVVGRGEGLVEETMDFVTAYAPTVVEDAARLGTLLETHGMTLGY